MHNLEINFDRIRLVTKTVVCNHLLAEGGYRGEIIEQVKKRLDYIIQVIIRPNDKRTAFKPTRERWVIERTFAWLDNDRRLCRNYELLLEFSENMVKLSGIKLLLNKI